ncbi:class I SAM-dependent methyltransferase [Kineococcus sp. NUM-3379]
MELPRVRLPDLPEALRWDHNAHHHPWLLARVPAGARVLDAGCGAGELARRLAGRGAAVDAVDVEPAVLERARALTPPSLPVRWVEGSVLDPDLPLEERGYDVVTAVASLHHLPLVPALRRFADLLRPGGRLLVVGLARPVSAADLLWEAAAVPANAARGAWLAARRRAGKPHEEGMPLRDPEASLAEVRAAAAQLLPGSRVRRRLYWRYTLDWSRPGPR